MSHQNACGFSVEACPSQVIHCRKTAWYCKFIKPFCTFVVSVLLALSMSHICEKYSVKNTLQAIKSDLTTMKNTLNLLSSELREISCIMPLLSEEIFKRSGVSDETASPDRIKELVKTQLETYDADKTGKVDYALEALGGKILSARNTENFNCDSDNSPRAIIQMGVSPGECWAFKGSTGSVVIQLINDVFIKEVSLEHISPMISPTGEITSAPKEFSIWGLKSISDENGFLLGRYTYDDSGSAIQYFEVENESVIPYRIVELQIHSNYGNEEYTCIYRVRVHGTLKSH